MTSYF